MPNVINVTACDNELIIMAYKNDAPAGKNDASYQLCRIQSGNYNSVNVTLNIKAGPYLGPETLYGVYEELKTTLSVYLPAGEYSLLLLGINWGGPTQFTVAVNNQPNDLPSPQNGDGLVTYSKPIPLKVS
ncbi:MAG TPA: hypothetical protein VK689_00895 [Armatimonadota bacterium]|nr:hypothetical protein [Armatimonadota bacterium]